LEESTEHSGLDPNSQDVGYLVSKESLYSGAIDIPTASPALVCGSLARILDFAEQREPAVAWAF
jgi:hypothetical protein